MGRPREHNEAVADALLGAAERALESGGVEAVSVRGVAAAAGTSTRAVYSLFGSKEGLLSVLGARAFELLDAGVRALPTTKDPARDVVNAGVEVFRPFALERPALFRLGLQQRGSLPHDLEQAFRPARMTAFAALLERVRRVEMAGLTGGRNAAYVARAFAALMEGLASLELKGAISNAEGEAVWRDTLHALLYGFGAARRSPREKPRATS